SQAQSPDYANSTPITVDWTAADATAGVSTTLLYVRPPGGSWTDSGLPAQTGNSGAFYYTPPSEGTYYFQTVSTDQAGNQETSPSGSTGTGDDQTIYDTTPPASTASAPAIFSLSSGAIPITWTAGDALAGVGKTCLQYAFENTHSWAYTLPCQMGISGTFVYTPTHGIGTYYFRTIATDRAGNLEKKTGADAQTRVQDDYGYSCYLPLLLRNYSPPVPDLSTSTKTADKEAVNAGEEIAYTLEIRNTGTVTADVSLTDPIPAQTTLMPGIQGCSYDNGQVIWNGSLPPGQSHTCRFTVRVNDDAGGSIVNIATLYDGFHPDPLTLRAETSVRTWRQGGLNGLTIYSLAVCPADADIIYAGSKENGVFKSSDGGRSWSATALADEMARGVAVNPVDCNTAYATSWGQGVFKTTDGGATWQPKNSGLDEMLLYALAVDPNNSRVIYLGTNSYDHGHGLFKSSDGGEHWTFMGLPNLSVVTIAVDPTPGSQVVYAGTWENGVYKSNDGGASWTPVNQGLADPNIYILAVDPTDTDVVYAATYNHGVYRSADGGANWTREWPDRVAYTVAVDGTGIAYAGTDGTSDGAGLWKREGGVWAALVKQPGVAPTVRSIAFTPDLLLAGTTDGVWWYGP
ncbi:MAG TPA: DUF11 domain-containing protein, partial [Anaerolineae bacterium]|nr:DUF11 domain-containing protein [Anaerolineae bacterium]